MTFKKSLAVASFLCATVALSLGLTFTFKTEKALFDKGDSYQKLWKRVDSCEQKGLTESAMKIVTEIYSRSKAENNAPQFVKAVIHKMKFAQYKEEFSQEKNINELLAEVQGSTFPIKPVLQSILAEAYWQYYQNNRYKFYNRSQTASFKNEDIATYDLKAIVNACISNYNSSLKNKTDLLKVKLSGFDDILIPGTAETRLWRPSLYDFLAHRALDFYKNSEAGVTKAAHQFALNEDAYLKTYSDFLKFELVVPQDSLDLKFYALKLFRELLTVQLELNNKDALLDLEFERLDFIYQASGNQLKDSIYLQSIKTLVSEFSNSKRLSEIKHKEAEWWLMHAYEYKAVAGDQYKWNRKKAYDICAAIIAGDRGSRGAKLAANTISQIETKALSITTEKVVDAHLPNRVLVSYSNVNKVYFKLVKTNYFEYEALVRKFYNKELLSKLLDLPVVTSFEQELPDDKDFNPHAVEVKVPAIDYGYYVLIASYSSQFSNAQNILCYQPYISSDISYLYKRSQGGDYSFYVLNRQTGKPLGNVTAQVWYSTYNYKKQDYEYQKEKLYTSNAEGYFKLPVNESNNNNFFVEFNNGKDKLVSSDHFYNYKDQLNTEAVTKSFIFTDRAIYRPGQTVYFKSILLKGLKNKYDVLPKQNLTLTFYDVNHQQISSQELITNDYGTVSGSFTAPQSGLTGQMEITDGYGSAYVSVEEYKRPKFETLFDTLKGSYKLNDDVSVKGFAKAYAGNRIDGAEVKYRVVRQINYPYWWYWYRPYYGGGNSQVEIANGFTKTNEKGEYEIKFKALPDPTVSKTDNPTYTYEINVDVTDINGETQSAGTAFSVGYKALELSFTSPETINLQNIPKMSVSAANLNGVEEQVTGVLTVYELKQPDRVLRKRLWEQPDKHLYTPEEFATHFPNDVYRDENNKYTWEKLKKSFSRNFNTQTDKNILIPEFKNLSPGVYLVEGVCKDKYGEEVKSLNYITVYNPSSNTLPYKTPHWNLALKTQVEPGDTAAFIIASSYTDLHCLYELESEQTTKTSFISPSLKPMRIRVEESDRGGMMTSTRYIKHGRIYTNSHYITVPFSNKDLNIEYSTYRNKLMPGQQEEWKLTIKNKKGDKVAAEMLASMYDASLDAFKPHYWNFGVYNSFYSRYTWEHSLEDQTGSYQYTSIIGKYENIDAINYDQLNYFGMNYYSYNRYYQRSKTKSRRDNARTEESELNEVYATADMAESAGAPPMEMDSFKKEESKKSAPDKSGTKSSSTENKNSKSVAPRKNFNETAFFFPNLQTNEQGEVIIKFTIPESLTKWKFMGFAHTKDLSYGQTQNECITQKELMVVPNAPRFFREGDKMAFVSKISNLSDKALTGTIELKFYDAFTEKEISFALLEATDITKEFSVQKGLSTTVEWSLQLPEGLQAIKYRVIAKAGNFSDGEEMVIPVLSNRMLVTESMPLPVRGNQTKEFNFTKFINQNNNSSTLKNHAYTLEFTANPAWYAVQSLPYLMEYPYECAEQTFARYYSNALASHIANSKPKIKEIFDSWKNRSPESFLSNLEKNQELKSLLLEETPWVLEAKNESENKKRVALLFDLNNMGNELNTALLKLEKMQTPNGAWPWFSGCPEDRYITQHIVTSFGHLQKLGVIHPDKDPRIFEMIRKALPFCDDKLREEFDNRKKYSKNYKKENNLSYMAIQYLYMRSYFKDIEISARNKTAFDYYKKQAQVYWLQNSRYMQGMIALGLNRYNDKKTPLSILRSLKQNALNTEEMGMYWKENYGGYYWYQAPIEMQALMIEAFDEILNDTKSVDDLKTWLIKSKQTQNWGTTRATTEAVYALLLRGTDWLSTEPNVEIFLGAQKLDPKNDPELKAEAGTGYFKKTFSGSDITPAMGKVKVVKKDAGVSWGSVYWQYFEQLDKITPHETPLKLSKKLFVETNTAGGPIITPITENNTLRIGDKVKVRIELRVDRDMEYLHLKDMRAAGFEPVNVISTYRYQDGLGYYESTRDASTNFFISYLPKGTYVFEYPVLVSHSGNFSNGISSIQCMYAPEFTSHSEGIRVTVTRKK